MNPLEMMRARIRELLDQRATHEQTVAEQRALVGAGTATAAQTSALRAARDAIVGIDAELDQQQAALREALDEETRDANAARMRAEQQADDATTRGVGGAHVTREERTYSRENDRRGVSSFFCDAFRAMQLGNMEARGRLERHADEARVEREGLSERAVSTGSFGGLVIPQYLIALAARVMRNGRPLANVAFRIPLPEQGMSLIIPRGTTGAAAGSQATENSALTNTDEVWGNLTVPVATIGGQQDVSRQTLERGTPGIDELVFFDLAGAYHAELDRQVITGSGAAGQMLGIANTAGVANAAAFGAAVTGANLNTKIAGAIAAIAATGVGLDAGMIAMHPRRWGYLTSLSDTTGRPLISPTGGDGQNMLAVNVAPGQYSGGDDPNDQRVARIVGNMQGLPVLTDANIPTNTGTNLEDTVIVLDQDMVILWEEGDGMPRQLRFEQTLGQNLTVKLISYGYAAFTAGRYPQASARVGGVDVAAGNGLVAPTF